MLQTYFVTKITPFSHIISGVGESNTCPRGQDLLKLDSAGATTFLQAVHSNDLACAEQLLQEAEKLNIAKELLNKANNKGATPLHASSFKGHMAMASFLLANGASVDPQTYKNDVEPETTPLTISCQEGHVAIVNALLEHGANLYHQRKDGADCAYLAAYNNRLAVLEAILTNNKDLVTRHLHHGFTILHVAAAENNFAITELLIKNGGLINGKDNKYGMTPLSMAAQFDGDLNMIKMLVKHGANPKIIGHQNKTPLKWAEEKSKQDIVKYLKQF